MTRAAVPASSAPLTAGGIVITKVLVRRGGVLLSIFTVGRRHAAGE